MHALSSMIRLPVLAMLVLASLRAAELRPNVLLVLADELGYGDLSSSGNRHVRTPNLDRLRAASTDFTRFIAAPSGAATRAQWLSGRHEFRCGVSHSMAGRNLIRPDVPVLPEAFLAAGYRTAIIGKWHLGEAYPCRPEDRGFEEVFVHGGGGLGQTPDHWGNSSINPRLRRNAGWVASTGYCTQVFVDEAKRWIGSHAAGPKPFFLYLALNVPHAPYEAPAGSTQRLLQAGLKEPLASYFAIIEDLDARVGDLLAELDRLQLTSNTLVLFASASGSGSGPAVDSWQAGMRAGHASPDDGGVRVPAFIRWPEKIAGKRVVGSLASPMDWFPTLASLCHVTLPESWSGEGRDLSQCLLGHAAFPVDRMIFTHVGHWSGDDSPERHRSQGFAVRDERWLLSGLELFDMTADPGQRANVFEQHPAEVARLLGAYGVWWNNLRAPLREPVRYVIGAPRQKVVRLSAHDWWPSREANGAASATSVATQAAVRRMLHALTVGEAVAETSGHWKLRAASAGHYQIQLSMLPTEANAADREKLSQLRAGSVHLRTGKREARMNLTKGATAAILSLDLAAGDLDLEAWFTGQLPDQRILGALFAEIQRSGDRKRPEIELDIHTIPKE